MSLQIGQPAPDFTLESHLGTEITLSSFKGHRNLVIVFFPLAWTPV
jgi:peroxiredoxin